MDLGLNAFSQDITFLMLPMVTMVMTRPFLQKTLFAETDAFVMHWSKVKEWYEKGCMVIKEELGVITKHHLPMERLLSGLDQRFFRWYERCSSKLYY